MRAWRYWIAPAAICSVILVVPAGASEPQQATTPVAVPPHQPSTTRPVIVSQQGQQGSWDRMGMRGFSVSLVVGDLAGTATADNLPAGAKKALSDMRDFLPYKSYRLLDTHWILCCSSSSSSTLAGRLRGAEEDEYSFSIQVRALNDWSELGIMFNLRDLGGTADQPRTVLNGVPVNDRSRRLAEFIRHRDDLQRRYEESLRKLNPGHPDVGEFRKELENVERHIRDLEQAQSPARTTSARARDSRPILDSNFSMKVGETVVIGTSSLKGNKALLALLTAASRNSTPPRER
jgi:hypothetical protein